MATQITAEVMPAYVNVEKERLKIKPKGRSNIEISINESLGTVKRKYDIINQLTSRFRSIIKS